MKKGGKKNRKEKGLGENEEQEKKRRLLVHLGFVLSDKTICGCNNIQAANVKVTKRGRQLIPLWK